MNKQAIFINRASENLPARSQSSQVAWLAILAFILLTALFIAVGAAKVLNIAFPAGAFLVGVFLYIRNPSLYVGFSWWICFLSAFVRRLVDYRSGFNELSPILLAPFLVMLIASVTLLKNIPRMYQRREFPFILVMSGILYAFIIGAINRPIAVAAKAMLDWIAPVAFGAHLLIDWRNYPAYRKSIQTAFIWGVLVMGLYGAFQYLTAPEWDRFWIISAEIDAMSAGFSTPEPLGIRVFSTLNSQEPFAAIMAAGLLVIFSAQSKVQSALRLPAFAAGGLSLMLTSVRSGWLGWGSGFLVLLISLKAKFQMRLVFTLAVLLLCFIPLALTEPFSSVIVDRFSTLSNLQNDGSASGRSGFFMALLGPALLSFVGEGIGGSTYDNALLAMWFNLGWVGTIPYLGGMLMLVITLFRSTEGGSDPFIAVARAVTVSALVRLPVNSPTVAASGMALWCFLGVGLAGIKYHRELRSS